MPLATLIATVSTVLTIAAFAGIVWWAYVARRRDSFDDAARAPFALPDEATPHDLGARR